MNGMEWVSVEDRLPQEGLKVISFDGYEFKIDYIIYAPDPIWACRLQREEIIVKYWMQIPKPPG